MGLFETIGIVLLWGFSGILITRIFRINDAKARDIPLSSTFDAESKTLTVLVGPFSMVALMINNYIAPAALIIKKRGYLIPTRKNQKMGLFNALIGE